MGEFLRELTFHKVNLEIIPQGKVIVLLVVSRGEYKTK